MCHGLSIAGMVPLLFIQKPTFILYAYWTFHFLSFILSYPGSVILDLVLYT